MIEDKALKIASENFSGRSKHPCPKAVDFVHALIWSWAESGFSSGYRLRDREAQQDTALLKQCEEALKQLSIQVTSQEYKEECGEDLDSEMAAEAYESMILLARSTLALLQKRGGG